MRHTIARPQEVRAFQWKHLVYQPVPMFVLRDFKAKQRARTRRRPSASSPWTSLLRLLIAWRGSATLVPTISSSSTSRGQPWTANAVRCRMKRLREKLGFGTDEHGEQIVAYTLRHTSATRASPQRRARQGAGRTHGAHQHRHDPAVSAPAAEPPGGGHPAGQFG